MNKINIALDYWKVLKMMREERKMTQEELGKILGVTSMMISHLELGRRQPKIPFFNKWIKVFGLEIRIYDPRELI